MLVKHQMPPELQIPEAGVEHALAARRGIFGYFFLLVEKSNPNRAKDPSTSLRMTTKNLHYFHDLLHLPTYVTDPPCHLRLPQCHQRGEYQRVFRYRQTTLSRNPPVGH